MGVLQGDYCSALCDQTCPPSQKCSWSLSTWLMTLSIPQPIQRSPRPGGEGCCPGARPGAGRAAAIDVGKATAARRYRLDINSTALVRPRPPRPTPARFDAPLTLPSSTCPKLIFIAI
ncbi:jg11725 [Pararge aegeria aegeria]|uniref:Jg11725 protein n=1 Tax=Pararge aegeria aegeria TaxID=348720 RepID=A0A8S4RZM9_9NEOP|nr:jg11725 [Pararge aegeria aegeria]